MPGADQASQFALKRSRAGRTAWAFAGAATLALIFLDPAFRAEAEADVTTWVLAAALLVMIPLLGLMLFRKGAPQVLEVSQDRLRLPISMAVLEIPLSEIEGLVLEEGRRPGLFLSTDRFDTFIPASRFASIDAARQAYQAIRERIGALPNGSVRLKVLEAPAEVAGRPWATQTLLVLILVAYAVTLAQGVLGSAIEYIRYGANAQVLIAQGQVWRLIASSFLHAASPLHVGLNAVGLWSMGVMAERLFGRSTFLAIYFGSAIGGALGSAAMQTGGFSVGASTALFGLFGALLYAQLVRFRGKVPVRYRVSDSAWFTMIALNMSLTILFPMIDWAAHVVGAVTGVLIAVLLISDEERLPIAHPSRIARISGVLLTLAAVVSVGFAVRNIVLWDPMGDTAVLKSLVLWDRAPPVLLNDLAFTIATQPSPPPEHLELADRAARRAVDADPSPMVVDTQATVAFRRGDLERAIELEAEVVNDPESEKLVRPGKKVNEVPFLATQLLRFIVARQARSGTLVGKDAPSGLSVRVENSRLAIRTETRIEKPIAVYVVAKEGDKPLGLAIVPIMPTPAFVEPPVINTSALDLPWADTASVTIGYIAKGNVKARIFEADPEALALPGP